MTDPFGGIKSIVCSVELTDEMVPLLRFAKQLGETFGSRVRLLHAIPEQDVREYKYLDVDFHQRISEMAADEIARKQAEAGTGFPLSITSGHIAQDAAETVLDQHADLILIGTREVSRRIRISADECGRYYPPSSLPGAELFNGMAGSGIEHGAIQGAVGGVAAGGACVALLLQ